MNTSSKSLINLTLIFCVWLVLGFRCSSTQPLEDAQAGQEIQKYQSSQLAICGGEKMRAGYLIREGRKVPFEAYDPKFIFQGQTLTPEEKARGIVRKYEAWFEPVRYRVHEGKKWSEWRNPQRAERMGRATFTLEAGHWDIKISEEFTKPDCAEFKKIAE